MRNSHIPNPCTTTAPIPSHVPPSRSRLFRSRMVTKNRKSQQEHKMISDKQLKANRANAMNDESVRPYPRDVEAETSASGQGPRTEEGRKRSSMNARRHGITGQVTTMTDEDRAAHDRLSQALIKDLAPEGAMEIQLAQRIATDSWRLNRVSAVEDNLFALGIHENGGKLCPDNDQIDDALTTARVFGMESKNLQLLTLYEQRLNRAIQKNLAMLQSLQAARKTRHEAAMKEAAILLKLSEMKGLEYSPTRDGFVFSNDQIHAAIDREQRLERASTTDFTKYRPRKFQTHEVLNGTNRSAASSQPGGGFSGTC
jgi:hypothetical protein